MIATSNAANARPTTVAFVNCFDATTFGRTVHLTPDEERRLRNVLAALRDYGFILAASFEPVLPCYGFGDVIRRLRTSVGAPFADAALAAAERSVASIEPAPAAAMPVWAFEPDGESEDVLLSSARLWNIDLLVEGLRVEGEDDPVPVPSVRDRYDRWADSAATLGGYRRRGCPGSTAATCCSPPRHPLNHQSEEGGCRPIGRHPHLLFFCRAPRVSRWRGRACYTRVYTRVGDGARKGFFQRFVGIAWDGPKPDPSGATPDGRNGLLLNAKADACGEIAADNPKMINPE
jgi:hypothetical protein